MNAKPCVLIYGLDSALLETRRQVLRQGGFEIMAISQLPELSQLQARAFRVLVLCHTLTPKDQQDAIAVSRSANPMLQTIVMTAYAPEFITGSSLQLLSPFDGPEALISQVRDAVHKSTQGYSVWSGNRTSMVNLIVQEHDAYKAHGWMYTGASKKTVQAQRLSPMY